MHRVNALRWTLLKLGPFLGIFLLAGIASCLQAQTASAPSSQQTTQPVAAQPTAGAQAPTTSPTVPARFMAPAYPVRPPADPAAVARGKQTFGVSCGFCHGSDARGGETGPNLVRSQLVLDDQHGEVIAPVIMNGRVDKGMPKFDFDMAQIADIAAFVHSLSSSTRGEAVSPPVNIVIGDARAGETYFNGAGKCSSCHSVTGDLSGIGAKHDPKTLQNLLLSGGGGRSFGPAAASASHVPPTTVTVTFPAGPKYEGKLVHVDAFNISLTASDGTYHSFAIHGAVPQIAIHNPLQQHLDMLPTIKDVDIHNLTAYLVTVK